MMRALLTGILYGSPAIRTSQAGKDFTTAKLRADGKDGATVWASLVAFGELAERLAKLPAGAALAVSGRAELSAWLDKNDEPKAGLSLVVDELATLKAKPKPRTPRPAATAGADFDDAIPDWT